jgi:hypothetical protein
LARRREEPGARAIKKLTTKLSIIEWMGDGRWEDGSSRSVEILSIHIVHIDTASFAMLRKKQENQVVFL